MKSSASRSKAAAERFPNHRPDSIVVEDPNETKEQDVFPPPLENSHRRIWKQMRDIRQLLSIQKN